MSVVEMFVCLSFFAGPGKSKADYLQMEHEMAAEEELGLGLADNFF